MPPSPFAPTPRVAVPMAALTAVLTAVLSAACSTTPALHPGSSHPPGPLPEARFDARTLEAQLRFQAADELMGRLTGEPGADVAARFIAEHFRAAGLRPVPGAEDYAQPVPFLRTVPPAEAHLALFDQTLRQGDELLVLDGPPIDAEAEAVYAGHGLPDDYDGLDVAGKIVVVRAGRPGDGNVQAALRAAAEKRAAAAEHGALALVELYRGALPWPTLVSYLSRPRLALDEAPPAASLPHLWLHDSDGTYADRLQHGQGMPLALRSGGFRRIRVTSRNVLGWIEGRHPERRHEFVVLTAHYDHLGAGRANGPGATPADSIFNGARDNAMGVVAVLNAAYALAAVPPDRSVLLMAFTGEESGLLGSRYYTEHPLLPLDQMVYALNVDGAGYSDTSAVTLIGLGRTTADPLIRQGAATFGLDVIPDPAPEQNLFDRSDNVHFAARGIPAPTFSPGFRAFSDPGVAHYYHRPTDEANDDFDFAYLLRFTQAYTHTARLIANAAERPTWTPGDPYEAAARALYGTQ